MRLALAAMAFLALLAPSAYAGTIDAQSGALVFSNAPEANNLRVFNVQLRSGAVELELWERGTTPLAMTDAARAAGCRHSFDEYDPQATPDPQRMWCPIPGALHADLGDGDDRLIVAGSERLPDLVLPAVAQGGAGNDLLASGLAADELRGGDGNDEIIGEEGADRLFGDGGDDLLHNHHGDDLIDGGDGNDVLGYASTINIADGADVLVGGPGMDEVSYRPRTSKVQITFDGQANDGRAAAQSQSDYQPPEKDNVANDVEIVQGGGGTDVFQGDARANVFRGGGDYDQLRGGGGDDVLDGETGGDIVEGGEGNDRLFGEVAIGGPGADHVEAAGSVGVRDGERDTVKCLSTRTKVIADKLDDISGPCGTVEREARAEETKRPTLLGILAPGGATLAGIARRGLFLKLRCPTGCSVTARLTVSAALARSLGLASRRVGSLARTFRPGQARARVVIPRRVARRLRKARRGSMMLRAKAVSGNQVLRIKSRIPPRF